jgi:tight adherence protein B
MKQLRESFDAAGLGHFRSSAIATWIIGGSLALGLAAFLISGVAGFGLAACVYCSMAILEGLRVVGDLRKSAVTAALPELVEGIASALSAGQDLPSAFADAAAQGPKALRRSIGEMIALDELGHSFEDCLRWLRVELSDVSADTVIELLLVSLKTGGFGLVGNLARMATNLRGDLAHRGEIQAKQGWVTGTAKLAILAPWVIAVMLSGRSEAMSFYASASGTLILASGLTVCVFAYWLVNRFGRLAEPRRVFAS